MTATTGLSKLPVIMKLTSKMRGYTKNEGLLIMQALQCLMPKYGRHKTSMTMFQRKHYYLDSCSYYLFCMHSLVEALGQALPFLIEKTFGL